MILYLLTYCKRSRIPIDETDFPMYNEYVGLCLGSISSENHRRKGTQIMADEYGANLVSVLDDEGNEHQFEILDAIETDDGRYMALLPVYDDPSDSVNDDGELIILEVVEENGEDMLVPIEDDDTFEEIASIFEERLSDLYEIEEMEDLRESE